MAGEIQAAAERLDERKRAAAGLGPERPISMGDEDEVRLAWSGLDLDLAEAQEIAPLIQRVFVSSVMAGAPPFVVAASLWFDGVATGLLIAEARAKAEASN